MAVNRRGARWLAAGMLGLLLPLAGAGWEGPLALPSAQAALGDDADGCHQDLLRSSARLKKGRDGQRARCLKFANYDACSDADTHTQQHEAKVRRRVAGAGSLCQAAIDGGAALADFGPTTCANEWNDCEAAVPAVATVEDLAECLICQEHGYDLLIRDVLGWPRVTPADPAERGCTRSIARYTAKAIKKAVLEVTKCARGMSKPFACALDFSPTGPFGKSLTVVERRVAACGIDSGNAPGALANLCAGSAADAADLAACFTGAAKCIACRGANSVLGASEDCTALSGFADCDGMF